MTWRDGIVTYEVRTEPTSGRRGRDRRDPGRQTFVQRDDGLGNVRRAMVPTWVAEEFARLLGQEL